MDISARILENSLTISRKPRRTDAQAHWNVLIALFVFMMGVQLLLAKHFGCTPYT